MKVAIVYQYYQGDDAPGHSLIHDLVQFLAERGHNATVISGESGYMLAKLIDLPWYRRIIRSENVGKVNVVRTFTYSDPHPSRLDRFLSYLSFSLSCPLGLLTIEKPDVILASSPPIFPMFSTWVFCKLRRVPLVIEVRDLWPASAVQMGIVRNKHIIGFMSWVERLLYNQCEKIVALTEGIRDDIIARGWPIEKIRVITCGVDTEKLYPDTIGAADIRDRYGWKNKKIVLYFGALGEANNIPVIIRAAQRLQSRIDIVFVLIGDGIKRVDVQNQVQLLGLQNIILLPPVPKKDARFFIGAADLCLVTLRDIPLFAGAIPTKLIDYMACGKAVLCGVRGEAENILRAAHAGVMFDPDNDEQLSRRVIELIDDGSSITQMGTSGLAYVKTHFSANMMRERMLSLLLSVKE